MTDDERKEMHAHDLQMSKDMGVPKHIYASPPDFIDWYGRFTVHINDREFMMAVTPSSLIVNESDSVAPVAHLVGSEWLESPLGRMFHATYLTSMINGGFQLFRKEDPSPFEGFESVKHTHMLVYTDGTGQKQFFAVAVEFASE